jgi:hypothetical protein
MPLYLKGSLSKVNKFFRVSLSIARPYACERSGRNITSERYKSKEQWHIYMHSTLQLHPLIINPFSLILYHLEVIFLCDFLHAYSWSNDEEYLKNSLFFDQFPLRYRTIFIKLTQKVNRLMDAVKVSNEHVIVHYFYTIHKWYFFPVWARYW